MKNRLLVKTTVSLFLVVFTLASYAGGKGHNIKVKINGISDTVIYIGNRFADKTYIVDTLQVDKDGLAIFKGEDELDGGIYFVYMPDKIYFEVLIGEQKFSLETDTTDLIKNMKVTGSDENRVFYEFQNFSNDQRQKLDVLKKRMKANDGNEDSTKVIKEQMKTINDGMKSYMSDIIDKYPKYLLAAMFRANEPIEIPESPKDEQGNVIDTLFGLHYHQQHYFDNIDFGDARLLRTPIIHQKMMEYLKKLTLPTPDSINKAVDFIIEKSRANDEVFHYVVSTLTNYYETSKFMGMDAVFVHMAEKYYISGEADWANSTLLSKMEERVMKIKPTLIGGVAFEINLPDTTLTQRHSMHAIDAEYTLVFFFESDCGHCKKMADKLVVKYDSLQMYGVEIYSVSTMSDLDVVKEFIKEKGIEWICVSDFFRESYFRSYYDIYSTPILYLLNDKKEIIAKRIGADQVLEIVQNEEKRKQKK